MILKIVNIIYTWLVLIAVIILLEQKKHNHSDRKRIAVTLLILDIFVLYLLLFAGNKLALPSWTEWIFLAIAVIIPAIFRKRFFPFAIHCRKCGKKLSVKEIIAEDDNLCQDCHLESHPEEKKTGKAADSKPSDCFSEANSVAEIPWDSWEPTERCTLTYLFDGDNVLLIEKKRGMGTGYFNAPGGHIELEETKYEAAVREAREETGLDMSELKEVGTLYFQFKDGIRMIGYVFFAYKYTGTMIKECDETRPFWCPVNKLDYSRMWEDDKLWLPIALEGRKFSGYFLFDDRRLLDSRIVIEEDE